MSRLTDIYRKEQALRFGINFIILFALFYGGCLLIFRAVTPGDAYVDFIAQNFNLIHWMRWMLLHITSAVLKAMGYYVVINETHLLVAGHSYLELNYSCLGIGVMCFFAAFVIAFPKHIRSKMLFLIGGLVTIQLLNVVRLTLLALYWGKSTHFYNDHHFIFNICIYILMALSLYFWIKESPRKQHAAN